MRHLRAVVNLIAVVLIVLATIRLSTRRSPAHAETADSPSVLSRRVGPLEFHGLAFDDAAERIGRAAGVEIVVDRSLGVIVSSVDFSLETSNDKTLDSVLAALVQQRLGEMAYFVDRGRVRITRPALVPVVTRIYDVHDIWRWVFEEIPTDFDVFRMETRRLSPDGQVGPRSLLGASAPPVGRQQAIETEAMYRIASLNGNCRLADGKLIVTQTAEGHRSLAELLQIIRQMHEHPAGADGRGD